MKNLALIGLLLIASLAFGQNEKPRISPRRDQQTSRPEVTAAPLSRAEMKAAFQRVERAMHALPGVTTRRPALDVPTTGVASRSEVLRQMDRLFEMARPHFKFTPPKVKFDNARLSLKEASTRPLLEKLIAWGAVAQVGPIATSKVESISLADFGDALGFFVARMAELTHTPLSKWTPGMMDRMEHFTPPPAGRRSGDGS
ncbi:MAG TPA: hypothetical protein VM328_01270 [Fimbriimonadaceae bacterium]|nr:hypothetical protein [Fimbriimonadaceae bacterium]